MTNQIAISNDTQTQIVAELTNHVELGVPVISIQHSDLDGYASVRAQFAKAAEECITQLQQCAITRCDELKYDQDLSRTGLSPAYYEQTIEDLNRRLFNENATINVLRAQLKGAYERAKMLLNAKNQWADRARKAEQALNDRTVQVTEPTDEQIAIALNNYTNYPGAPGWDMLATSAKAIWFARANEFTEALRKADMHVIMQSK